MAAAFPGPLVQNPIPSFKETSFRLVFCLMILKFSPEHVFFTSDTHFGHNISSAETPVFRQGRKRTPF